MRQSRHRGLIHLYKGTRLLSVGARTGIRQSDPRVYALLDHLPRCLRP